MIKGSVIFREMKCGKPNCKCAQGEGHFYLCICYKEKAKSRTVYVDKEQEAKALVWSRNYKKLKQLLQAQSEINLELLKRKRRAKKKG
jgi:hypothetical protein